jgi:hypothetical protein
MKKKVKNWSLLVVAVLTSAVHVQALTGASEEVTCPIGGEKLQRTYINSYTSSDQELDSREFFDPRPVPQCPSDGFVMYQAEFSEAEVAILQHYVRSKEFQSLRGKHVPYYLAARLKAQLGREDISYLLLQASWQATNPKQYRAYAIEALDAYERQLRGHYESAERRMFDRLIAGELERRLGRFNEAKERFVAIAGEESLATYQGGRFASIVCVQLALIEVKSSEPHRIPTTPLPSCDALLREAATKKR